MLPEFVQIVHKLLAHHKRIIEKQVVKLQRTGMSYREIAQHQVYYVNGFEYLNGPYLELSEEIHANSLEALVRDQEILEIQDGKIDLHCMTCAKRVPCKKITKHPCQQIRQEIFEATDQHLTIEEMDVHTIEDLAEALNILRGDGDPSTLHEREKTFLKSRKKRN